MEYQTIRFETKDEMAWIQFNRPEKLNAMNSQLLTELEQALIACEENQKIRSIILTGNEKAFIAGADIGPYAKADVSEAHRLGTFTMNVQERLADIPKPTIAAISGFALGGGLEIALCCDFRLAADNAVLGLPEKSCSEEFSFNQVNSVIWHLMTERFKGILWQGESLKQLRSVH